MSKLEKERVESVRKEKTKESYSQKGITTQLIDNFKIRVPKNCEEKSNQEILDSIKETIIRQMWNRIQNMSSYDEIKKLAEVISFGTNKIKVTPIEQISEEEEMKDYLNMLLQSCIKLRGYETEEFYKEYLPLEIEYTLSNLKGKYENKIAYSISKKRISKRFHKKEWYVRGKKSMGGKMIVDLSIIFATVFLYNTVESFLIKNQELYYYKRAVDLLNQNINQTSFKETNTVYVPKEAKSRMILVESLKKYDLVNEDTKFIEKEELNKIGQLSLLEYDPKSNSVTNFTSTMYEVMLFELIKLTEYIKDKIDRAIRETSNYAKSFQTKKHINLQTQEVMKNNKFLVKYGYVELDNDVSLEKFKVIDQEFEKLTKQIFIPQCMDYSFRIKKLGKHRAAGIHYPEPIRATIFDLDSPAAYCHELGHQIDHVLAEQEMLSESVRFIPIIEKYKEAVEATVNNLDDNHPFKQVWNGSTKYNANYYCLPTEIFARSYELYLHEKGIRSSLLKESFDNPVYPGHDKEYIRLICNYFDKLFSLIKIDEFIESNVTEIEVINPIPKNDFQIGENNNIVYQKMSPSKGTIDKQIIEQFEQLTLF